MGRKKGGEFLLKRRAKTQGLFKHGVAFFLCFVPIAISAHQPVMDMAPRWKGGFGIQTRLEIQHKNELIQGQQAVLNPLNLESKRTALWFEGVVSFTRERRVSVKIPYVSREETVEASLTTTKKDRNAGGGGISLLDF